MYIQFLTGGPLRRSKLISIIIIIIICQKVQFCVPMYIISNIHNMKLNILLYILQEFDCNIGDIPLNTFCDYSKNKRRSTTQFKMK